MAIKVIKVTEKDFISRDAAATILYAADSYKDESDRLRSCAKASSVNTSKIESIQLEDGTVIKLEDIKNAL